MIAEKGGVNARTLYATLCEQGSFHRIDPALFAAVLRDLGRSEVMLIEQSGDGTLLLGSEGERIVEHYSFYAVFQTPREVRLTHDGHLLGTLPVSMVLATGMAIVFSGHRWRIEAIHGW